MPNLVTAGGAAPAPLATGLSAGENLAINEAVMIGGVDNQLFVATVALGGQVIGIMRRAIAIGIAVELTDIALQGEIIEAIVGAAIVRGDRLIIAVTTGRLGPLNTLSHNHVAFTTTTTPLGGTTDANEIFDGDTGLVVREGAYTLGLARCQNDAGGARLTINTSIDGPVSGLVIAKALESNAVVGTLVRVIVV